MIRGSTLLCACSAKDGIVFAADSAVHDHKGTTYTGHLKVFRTGRSSVVAMTGAPAWGPGDEITVDWLETLKNKSERLQRNPTPIRSQVERLAADLAADATDTMPPDALEILQQTRGGWLGKILVAGFDASGSVLITAREVAWRKGRFRMISGDDLDTHFVIMGRRVVPEALLKEPRRFPEALARPEIMAFVDQYQRNVQPTVEDVRNFFLFALEMTVVHGREFDIPDGWVNWPMDVAVVTLDGVNIQRVNRESYLCGNVTTA